MISIFLDGWDAESLSVWINKVFPGDISEMFAICLMITQISFMEEDEEHSDEMMKIINYVTID